MLKFMPQKGKAFDKLPQKTLAIYPKTLYIVSTKFDGNQVFIQKIGNTVRWFTSDWKEFDLPKLGRDLLKYATDFTIIAEMNYMTEGKQGDRLLVQGKITSERANFRKGIPCQLDESLVKLKCFDYLAIKDSSHLTNVAYEVRLYTLERLTMSTVHQIQTISYIKLHGRDVKAYTEKICKQGWEGTMSVEPDTPYETGKRVNHSIKTKFRPTVDLLCIGTEEGEGKYAGMIGAVILQDNDGRVVSVGSGLSDKDRGYHEDYFIGSIIEISYEQIMDTYQQPAYERKREDKSHGE